MKTQNFLVVEIFSRFFILFKCLKDSKRFKYIILPRAKVEKHALQARFIYNSQFFFKE
jgi:hypothetical protein